MAPPDRSSTRHRVVLRAEWSDRDGGTVVVMAYRGTDAVEIFARSCDAWCFSAHVHKGAERAVEALLYPGSFPVMEELPWDVDSA